MKMTPSRALKKKVKKLTKGTLVKWTKQEFSGLADWRASPTWRNLKPGDFGIVLSHSLSAGDLLVAVYWQRIGMIKEMMLRDIHIERKDNEPV